MKTIEEKAKAYDKSIQRAEQLHVDGVKQVVRDTIEYIFPELKENEDERIRKWCIKLIKATCDYDSPTSRKEVDDAIAWLEKQGESNPYSGVSFNYNGDIWGMCARDNGVDILFNKKLIQHISSEKQGELKQKQFDLDVLEKHITKDSISELAHTVIVRNGWEIVDAKEHKSTGWGEEDEIEIPFGAKDSELQKATYYIPKGFHAEIDDDKVVIKKGEKPTEWSEEDKEMLNLIIEIFKVNHPNGYFKANELGDPNMKAIYTEEIVAWLKGLKQRNI